ncbi:MAG: branched-chain amino acid transaminase [Polyangiaceae bacterium]|nr:branched-chain amino acid transaminase [Polyangiaceae bacterium]
MVEPALKFWRDGEIRDWATQGSVSLLTHSLHYGVGAFEGIRAYRRADGRSAVFRLREHIKRLYDSCRLVMITPNLGPLDFERGCCEVLSANGMSDGYLRPMVLLGDGAMGILPVSNPTLSVVMAWSWGAYLGQEGLDRGIRCKVSSYARHHINVAFAKGKITGQYINSVMAKTEAKGAGFDEALMLDVNGYVSEGSGENIFLVKDGRITTPPLSASILAGITRDTVITLAEEEGIPLREAPITRDELYLADEVFLTGTAAEVTPVREVDHRTIGQGCRGEITARLQQRYFDVVKGSDDSHPEWLARY